MGPLAALESGRSLLARRWQEVPLRVRRARLFAAAPDPALREDVEHLWWLEVAEPLTAPAVRRCPSKATVDVILALDGHFCQRAEGWLFGEGERAPYVIGPTTASAEVVSTGRCVAVGARIRPGRAADLFRTSAADLQDRAARLADLCRLDLRDPAATGAGDPDEAAGRLEHALLELRRGAGERDPLVAAAVRLIERRRGAVTVKAVARCLGSTSRQLERRFRDRVGLSPKRWCRIARLDHAMGLLAAGAPAGFAEVADACGYHDQAHLTRDFRELAGVTPGAFVRAQGACQ